MNSGVQVIGILASNFNGGLLHKHALLLYEILVIHFYITLFSIKNTVEYNKFHKLHLFHTQSSLINI